MKIEATKEYYFWAEDGPEECCRCAVKIRVEIDAYKKIFGFEPKKLEIDESYGMVLIEKRIVKARSWEAATFLSFNIISNFLGELRNLEKDMTYLEQNVPDKSFFNYTY